jgi:hypothetical protein
VAVSLEAEVASDLNCSFIIVLNIMILGTCEQIIKIVKNLATWINGGSFCCCFVWFCFFVVHGREPRA